MWTIYTFPYRQSGPFTRFLIIIKIRVFRENRKYNIGRRLLNVRYVLKIVSEFSENLKRQIVTFLAEYSINFAFSINFFQNFPDTPQQYSKYFSQAINSLITGWTVFTKNINPSVLPIDLPAVDLYVRTSGFIFLGIDSPTSY